jgi:chromosome partitioning protein
MTATKRVNPEDLLGIAEVAEMAGVTRQAATNWRLRKGTGFPEPVLTLAMGPLFLRPAVEKWLKGRARP